MGPVPARPISVNPGLNFCSVFIFFDSYVLFTLSNILYCHYCISELFKNWLNPRLTLTIFRGTRP